MDYGAFVRAQQHALLHTFFADPAQCWIGTTSLRKFDEFRFHGRGSWRPLATCAPTDAVIYRCPAGEYELWVKPRDKAQTSSGAYRRMWRMFVAAMAVENESGIVEDRSLHVDHLLPETFAARQNYSHVRVMAVDGRSNVAVGSAIERPMARRPNPGRSFLADWFTVAKVSGFLGSFSRNAPAGAVMTELQDHLRLRGFQVPSNVSAHESNGMEAILRWSRTV